MRDKGRAIKGTNRRFYARFYPVMWNHGFFWEEFVQIQERVKIEYENGIENNGHLQKIQLILVKRQNAKIYRYITLERE